MPSFALVTEGITDQVVIERIIYTVIENSLGEEPDINILQPLRDATDDARQAAGSFGGWERVLDFCTNTEKLIEALDHNEFIVFQIDTDCCGHVNFDVPYYKDGTELTAEELARNVQDFLEAKLTPEFMKQHGHRVIFAIAVHSTECWLMPFYAALDRDKRKEKSCELHLQRALTKSKKTHEKTFRCYSSLSDCFNKLQDINNSKGFSRTLEIFIDSLITKVSHSKA